MVYHYYYFFKLSIFLISTTRLFAFTLTLVPIFLIAFFLKPCFSFSLYIFLATGKLSFWKKRFISSKRERERERESFISFPECVLKPASFMQYGAWSIMFFCDQSEVNQTAEINRTAFKPPTKTTSLSGGLKAARCEAAGCERHI